MVDFTNLIVENVTIYLTKDSLDSSGVYVMNLKDLSHYYDTSKTLTYVASTTINSVDYNISSTPVNIPSCGSLEITQNDELKLNLSSNSNTYGEIISNEFDLTYKFTYDSVESNLGTISFKVSKGIFGVDSVSGTISLDNPMPHNQNKTMNLVFSNKNSISIGTYDNVRLKIVKADGTDVASSNQYITSQIGSSTTKVALIGYPNLTSPNSSYQFNIKFLTTNISTISNIKKYRVSLYPEYTGPNKILGLHIHDSVYKFYFYETNLTDINNIDTYPVSISSPTDKIYYFYLIVYSNNESYFQFPPASELS